VPNIQEQRSNKTRTHARRAPRSGERVSRLGESSRSGE